MSIPLVSVLMGVRYISRDTKLLARSVHSILQQSISDLELLICDDGSSREAVVFLEWLSAQDDRVGLVRRGNCLSLSQKLNVCLGASRGKWLVRMDDDDFSHPHRVEVQLDYLKVRPEITFAGCGVNLLREGRIVGQRYFPEYPTVKDFYFSQPFIHPTLVFRREALLSVGGYSEEACCSLCEDYDLLLRMYAAGYVGANVQEVLFDYTLPVTTKGARRMRHRWNEAVTRWRRFTDLGCLPQALPYVAKPLLVGMLPEKVLAGLKKHKMKTSG